MARRGHVILIDDDDGMREMIAEFLSKANYQVTDFPLARKAFKHLNAIVDQEGHLNCVDMVISHIQMPEMDGMEFVERIKKLCPEIPIILTTSFGSIELATESMRMGAYDYIVKPFQLAEVEAKVARGIQVRRLKMENQNLHTEVQRNWPSSGKLIGKSKVMCSVFKVVDRVAKAKANVLITGESGTGKEVVARAIHEGGLRASCPFVAINCTAIPESLLESELFGHAKGSFTGAIVRKRGLFEEAGGGTLFLDEIGNLDMTLQVKLLRVLQERKIKAVVDNVYKNIDVRIVAATHKDLSEAIKGGRFREDLYYRLAVIPIHIPPLRYRKEDIPVLARFFLKKYSLVNHSPVKDFSNSAIEKLMNYPWNGNVRELENIVERVVVLTNKEIVGPQDLSVSEAIDSVEGFFDMTRSKLPTISDLERSYIKYVLKQTGGRKEKASQILGINRRTLYRKEREYGFVEKTPQKKVSSQPKKKESIHRSVEPSPLPS